jgi:FkbM family methyltransferase
MHASNSSVVLEQLQRITGTVPPLYLVDVGASGGLHPVWRLWDTMLHAVGIDPLVKEVERLRSIESNPNVGYEAALVIGPSAPADASALRSNYVLHRTSAYLGTILNRLGADAAKALSTSDFLALWDRVEKGEFAPVAREANFRNVAEPISDPFYGHYQRLFEKAIGLTDVQVSERRATLDDILEGTSLPAVDLIKIDTDGYELEVLRGARRTLDSACLMVEVECQFHGLSSADANVFANIDIHLRELGFTLVKLSPMAYSRAALPRPFVYPELPAQTVAGPIQWADALYARDLLASDAPADLKRPRKAQIMACLFELYGLEDMAAEIVLRFRGAFSGADRSILDALAAKALGDGATYDEAIRRFTAGTARYRQ